MLKFWKTLTKYRNVIRQMQKDLFFQSLSLRHKNKLYKAIELLDSLDSHIYCDKLTNKQREKIFNDYTKNKL